VGPEETAAVLGCLAARAPVWATESHLPGELPRAGPAERIHHAKLVRLGGVAAPVVALHTLVDSLVALVALVLLLPAALLLGVLVGLETRGSPVVGRPVVDLDGQVTSAPRFRTRKARALAREGTTWSVDIPGRVGPVGRALRRTRLDRLPAVVSGLLGRARPRLRPRPGRVGSPPAPGSDQTQVDAGQLAR
jgi:lipopolysaccharide/colanic/teichoic acid biosynthesis glycosyltransferase